MENDNLYFLGKAPETISEEQQLNLLRESTNGNILARNKLIEHNVKLVISEVHTKYKNCVYEQRDLVSTGIIGLIKSIDTFKLDRNCKFATYAVKCIDNEINGYFRKEKKYNTNKSIYEAVEIDSSAQTEGHELIDTLSDDKINIEENYIKQELISKLKPLIKKLPILEKKIVILYFGFMDTGYSQKQISQILNISQSYVSRIIEKVVCDFQQKLLSEKIKTGYCKMGSTIEKEIESEKVYKKLNNIIKEQY